MRNLAMVRIPRKRSCTTALAVATFVLLSMPGCDEGDRTGGVISPPVQHVPANLSGVWSGTLSFGGRSARFETTVSHTRVDGIDKVYFAFRAERLAWEFKSAQDAGWAGYTMLAGVLWANDQAMSHVGGEATTTMIRLREGTRGQGPVAIELTR